jgi:hypothetical protein
VCKPVNRCEKSSESEENEGNKRKSLKSLAYPSRKCYNILERRVTDDKEESVGTKSMGHNPTIISER